MIHYDLVGDWTPRAYALGRTALRRLNMLWGNTWQPAQKFVFDDCLIIARHEPPFQYLTVIGPGGYFEFMTSGKPVETFETTGTIVPFTAYKAAVVTCNVFTAAAAIADGAKDANTIAHSPLGRPAQVGLIDEPVAYPAGKTLLYDSYAPLSPHTGAWLRSYADVNTWGVNPFATATREPYIDRGSLSPFTLRDIDFDIPFQFGEGKAKATRAYIRGDADWPRANGLQTVVSADFGSRRFGIYNDAFGQFFVFPVGEITAETGYDQNVPSSVVKGYKPELPAWVFVSDKSAMQQWEDEGAKGAAIFPDTDWKFSHDGKKATAVVFERHLAVFDTTYYGTAQGPNPVDATKWAFYRDNFTGALSKFGTTWFNDETAEAYTNRYSMAPGVLELGFKITLTGTRARDFTVEITVTEIRRPTTTPFYTVLAGYSWVDIKAADFTTENQHYDIRKGDLVTLDLEQFYKPTFVSPLSSFGFRPTFLALKNLTKATELRSFPAARNIPADKGVPTAIDTHGYVQAYNLVDYDLPTLSFALRIHFYCNDSRTVPKLTTGTMSQRYTVGHFGISIYTLNQFRETLYPETIEPFGKAELDFRKQTSGRDAVAGMTFLPLNLCDTWANPDYAKYRNYFMVSAFAKDFGSPPPVPDAATVELFELGFGDGGSGNAPVRGPMYVTDPCLAWNLYARRLFNILHVTEQSTFFAHPNGGWAFYDQQYIYNKTGIPALRPNVDGDYTANTYDGLDTSSFEHVIFDKVHFNAASHAVETGFRELYNRAVVAGTAAETLHADLQVIDITELRAVFEITPITASGTTAAMVTTTWGGKTGYYLEGSYMKHAGNTAAVFGNQYGWLVPSLGDLFVAGPTLPGLATRVDFFSATPIKFSSAVLL